MVIEISRIDHRSLEHSVQVQSSLKVQSERRLFSDVICYGKESGVIEKFIVYAQTPILWVYVKAKWLFSKIFSCFGLFKSSVSHQLQIFKNNLSKIQVLQEDFLDQKGKLQEKEFKEWWMVQFDSLDPEVQTMLLIEDIKRRQPEDSKEDKEKWARDNLEECRTLATEFIVKLGNETCNGYTFSPIEDLPDYLEGLKIALESKIRDLESNRA